MAKALVLGGRLDGGIYSFHGRWCAIGCVGCAWWHRCRTFVFWQGDIAARLLDVVVGKLVVGIKPVALQVAVGRDDVHIRAGIHAVVARVPIELF